MASELEDIVKIIYQIKEIRNLPKEAEFIIDINLQGSDPRYRILVLIEKLRIDLDKVISFYNSEPKSTYEPQTQLIKTLQEYKCKRNEWPIAELPSGEEVIERYLKANKVSAENIQEVKEKYIPSGLPIFKFLRKGKLIDEPCTEQPEEQKLIAQTHAEQVFIDKLLGGEHEHELHS